MDELAAVDGALRALGEMSGCALGLDDDGMCTIELAGGAEVTIEVDEAVQIVHLHAPLMQLPIQGRTELLEEALAISLFGVGSDGAAVGLDRATDGLILWFNLPLAELDPETFAGVLTAFAEAAASVRERLRADISTAPAPLADEPSYPTDVRYLA